MGPNKKPAFSAGFYLNFFYRMGLHHREVDNITNGDLSGQNHH
jgi:hypothetical protein